MKFLLILSSLLIASSSYAETASTKIETSSLLEKKTNLKVYPTMLFMGGMRGDLLFNVGESWTLGPSVENVNTNWVIYRAQWWGAGVASTYHFGKNPREHSFYLAPELKYRKGEVGYDDLVFTRAEGNFQAYTAALTVGYQFSWPAINLWIGTGASHTELEVSNVRGRVNLFGWEGSSLSSNEVYRTGFNAWEFDFAIGIPF